MRKIILASTSPRRKEILEKSGLSFDVVGSDYEEDIMLDMTPTELAKHLSKSKAEDVAKKYDDAIIIAADTFIAFHGQKLGKPKTEERAGEMLRSMSGEAHSVITGYTIIDAKTKKEISKAVETKVYFRELTEKEIDDYIATGEPLDKAGAYAIQGKGAALVEKVEGDYDNVVGLPLDDLLKTLRQVSL